MKKQPVKSRMPTEERAQRRAEIGKAASEKVAKSEQLNFRIDERAIIDIQDLAFQKGMPVGTMVRDWVLERLIQEKIGNPDISGKVLHVLGEIHGQLNSLFKPATGKR